MMAGGVRATAVPRGVGGGGCAGVAPQRVTDDKHHDDDDVGVAGAASGTLLLSSLNDNGKRSPLVLKTQERDLPLPFLPGRPHCASRTKKVWSGCCTPLRLSHALAPAARRCWRASAAAFSPRAVPSCQLPLSCGGETKFVEAGKEMRQQVACKGKVSTW